MPSHPGPAVLTFLSLLLVGCAAGRSAGSGSAPPEVVAPPAPAPTIEPAFGGPWQAPMGADQPLVGRAWSPTEGLVDRSTLVAALRGSDYVLLGEKHDNPDHHRLQAELLAALSDTHPSVVFEMLDADDDAALAGLPEGSDADALAEAVAWDAGGWPDFAIYRPVFEAALRGGRVVAGNPAREDLKDVMMQRLASRPPEQLADLGLTDPLPPELTAALDAQIEESHCGYANADLVAMMADGQRYKDAWMARRLREAAESGPGAATLIAGGGHARSDRGVPYYLPATATATSVLFVEIQAEQSAPEDYDEPGFDYLVFTPRMDDEDPCEKFRKSLEKLGPVK